MNRKCFYIDPTQDVDENGYIPSLVTENEPGHAPLVGNGSHAQPWYWGKTLEQANAIAKQQNERLGLTDRDVIEIISSSMFAGRR